MLRTVLARRQQLPAMTLEGVLGPNSLLDDAAAIKVDGPDALCVAAGGKLLFSSATRIMALEVWGNQPSEWASFEGKVTALCVGPAGLVAVGLSDGRLAVLEESGRTIDGWRLPPERAISVVDCIFRTADELLLLDCGYGIDDSLLARATWEEEGKGQLLALSRSGDLRVLASGLHCPMGLCLDPEGAVMVSLLERASIIDAFGKDRQTGYPGYLGRIRRTTTGYAIACLSRRDPLIEFLKTERAFVAEMKAKIEPRHWIAPRISPEFAHDFPIELGATRLFGQVKPWAPSFSYGLLIETDDRLMPVRSAHSRASGRRHAISDVAIWNGDKIAVSKASGELLNLGAHA